MSNKEHVEALTILLEFQVIAGERDRSALRAAIRALEAEDDSVEFNRGYAAGRKDEAHAHASLESRYRALVEAAKSLQDERIRRGTSQVSAATWDVLADALDAVEE